MHVALPELRSRKEQTAQGLSWTFPARRSISALLFLPVWLMGWCFAEVTAIRELLWGRGGPGQLFLVFWLLAWTIGGSFAFFSFFYQLLGNDIVTLTPGTLALKRDLAGFGWSREFDRAHVRNLRVSLESDWMRQRKALIGGPIAFDYGARTIRFGGRIEEAEACAVVKEMNADTKVPLIRPSGTFSSPLTRGEGR